MRRGLHGCWRERDKAHESKAIRRRRVLIGARQAQRLMRYLKARGHIERTDDRDLIRPVGARDDELPLG